MTQQSVFQLQTVKRAVGEKPITDSVKILLKISIEFENTGRIFVCDMDATALMCGSCNTDINNSPDQNSAQNVVDSRLQCIFCLQVFHHACIHEDLNDETSLDPESLICNFCFAKYKGIKKCRSKKGSIIINPPLC